MAIQKKNYLSRKGVIMHTNINKSLIKIGYSYQVKLPQYFRPRRLHIRAIVDGQFVYAFFGKNKQRWHWGIENPWMIDMLIQGGQFDIGSQLKTPAKYFKKE